MILLVILSVAATILVNALANALPINGQTTAEISNRFDVLFTPAGYVFAIWGLIYVGLVVFAVYQALPSQRSNPRVRAARPWIAASGVANIAWILLWHYNYLGPTLVAMAALLGTLILAYLGLQIGRVRVSARDRWMAQIPVGVYLGWVSVATIANLSVVVYAAGWDGWGISPQVWTIGMMVVALVVAAVVAWRRADPTVALVLAWAFAGIAQRNAAESTVLAAAWGAALLAVVLAVVGWRRQPAPRPA
jgi:hypothetical protein